ncbi:conjugative coupling factor TraD [Legionella beliardensis]|uniref:Conjugative coupling factor TraD n=1 Tax=Legionella beliardensis TaxID=91822 RepID=A0A378JS50_9GAMM|nr:conjugative coupling factor TraD [Legionella beliardensis]
MKHYPVENLLREPTEFYSSLTFLGLATIALKMPHVLLLTKHMSYIAASILSGFGFYRFTQGFRVKRYQKRLKAMSYYALSTKQVPLSKKYLFIGRGFLWTGLHTQRLHQIKQVGNLRFIHPGKLYQKAREYARLHPKSLLTAFLNNPARVNPLKPLPPVGGKPYLHGLGNKDKPILIGQEMRVGHTFVLGTTRVGKTRLASILINQDIRNGDAVIVVDPKGDLDLVRDMYSACLACARLSDFKMVHLGFPEASANYNPLKNFEQLTEVATRITDAIGAEGEGKQFADFAWKYVNLVVKALLAMNEPINYEEIGFYLTRLDQLLMRYCDTVFAKTHPDYLAEVQAILVENDTKVDKYGNPYPPMDRAKAVLKYIKQYVSDIIEKGDIKAFQGHPIIELYDAASLDKQYYDKITASVGPVLAKINSSSASSIFSGRNNTSEVELMTVIKAKQVLYIGLDSLSNTVVAEGVGKAFLSDLVSTAGKIYKEPAANYRVNIHCDELSEIIQESFVKILNKAGGAGFQVTAYAQTKQDLEVALGSRAMAEMTEGNLNTIIMLRVKNTDTAKVLTDILPKVDVISHTQVSTVNDTPHGEDQVYFNTTNEDRVQMTSIPMLEPSDVCELPKGQAFVLVNGGELYKIRIPLPLNDGLAPDNMIAAMKELNSIKLKKAVHVSALEEVNREIPAKDLKTLNSNTNRELESWLPQDEETEARVNAPVMVEENKAQAEKALTQLNEEESSGIVRDFINWLHKRIESKSRQFNPDYQLLVKTSDAYPAQVVFIKEEVLAKYQARSGINAELLAKVLTALECPYFIKDQGNSQIVYRVELDKPLQVTTASLIQSGERIS